MQIFSTFREATKHAQITCILGGYQREWHLHHSESDKVKIPFTLNLAILADELLKQGTIQPPGVAASGPTKRAWMERCRLTTALWIGIFFLLRKSEFLPESASFRRHHLRFQDDNRHDIPYHLIGIAKAYLSPSILSSASRSNGQSSDSPSQQAKATHRLTHHPQIGRIHS